MVGDGVVGGGDVVVTVVVVVNIDREYTHAAWNGASSCTVLSADINLQSGGFSVYSIPAR